MAAILVSQSNEMAAMLVYQTNYPMGVELFSYVNTFFHSNKLVSLLAMDKCTIQTLHLNYCRLILKINKQSLSS